MNFYFLKSILVFMFFSMVVVFQNCSDTNFTSDPSVSASNIATGTTAGDDGNIGDPTVDTPRVDGNDPICRPKTVTENKIVKVLFVMDTSGSNMGLFGLGGTDPNKVWRLATVTNFINQHRGKTNFYYGLITFQGSTAQAQIKVNGTAGFSNDATVVDLGIDSFIKTEDAGNTPYKAALSMAKSMIAADLAVNAAQNASYAMVMVSDGQPTDYKTVEELIPDAAAIKALAPKQVSLNSVYYYLLDLDITQSRYLKSLSTVGGGSFITANSNQALAINDVINLPSVGCE